MGLEIDLRETIRGQGKADSTADAYWGWVKDFLLFARDKRGEWVHPSKMGKRQVEIWLKHLANQRDVSANTQNQAFSAICYLYRHVLKTPLVDVSAMRAKRPDRIREVLDQSELVALFGQLRGPALLAARMMYASSFRIGEIGRLRIKDISFERKQIAIRGAKGEKDRLVGFPKILHDHVARQMESAKVIWRADNSDNLNGVSLPHAYGRKSPKSHLAWAWWYLFPADNYSKDPITGKLYRHHRDMGHIARQIKNAAEDAEIPKHVTSHCLRHSFATHSIENGVPIHVIQKLMGHADISTTETYLHVSKNGATSAESPLAKLEHDQPNLVTQSTQTLGDALSAPMERASSKALPANWRIVG